MKKSNFVAMILGTISCIFFALGMCMTMIAEWNAFRPGVILGVVGLLFALVTVIVWRKMEHKAPIKMNGKTIGTVFLGIIGALALGIGMCFVMVWGNLIPGIIIGLIGILLLMCLIPICKGLK
ncbi:hypothetical protein LK537_07745 [Lachnoclostridium pacaense]|uniref:hypothetical protein n=1 Tax=Enterocloster hominis (ex Hitch et al. 2024) TaxID=1917870 RepID=UPI001D110C63|nr:hypothetical protein [Lachnoclostridium pacaense]MCC2817178.1 hypothetical protein [Lachnoclostridium pacaense]